MKAQLAAQVKSPLNEIGFPEFTAKLITDVFDALISANTSLCGALTSSIQILN